MIEFRIVPDEGETYELTATSRDLLMWEKTTKGKTFQKLMEDLSMVDLYKVAWHASRRQGLIDQDVTLKQFEEGFEVEFEGESDEADPTRPGRSDER